MHWEEYFFNRIIKYKTNNLTGIELDKSLIDDDIRTFFNKQNRFLILDDFFNFSIKNKFDVIIMNPPYVRQELLKSKKNLLGDSLKF